MLRHCCLIGTSILTLTLLFGPAAAAERPQAEELNKDRHLAGWWRFDETAGATAADSSANHRSGTLTGGLSFENGSVPGCIGRALQFDGEDDLVRITGYRGVVGTAPRSISVWVKTDRPVGEIVSWGKKDFGRMWILGFIRKHLGVTPEGGYYYMAAGIHDNQWHHVAAVVREAELPSLQNDVTLYLDGTIAEIDNIGLLDLWPIQTEPGRDVTIGEGFRGAIDDLRIYDRALSEDEVVVLFRMGKPKSPAANRD